LDGLGQGDQIGRGLSPIVRLFTLKNIFLNLQAPQFFSPFHTKSYAIILTKKIGLGLIFGDFFASSSGRF
jgi:hypothetical protein